MAHFRGRVKLIAHNLEGNKTSLRLANSLGSQRILRTLENDKSLTVYLIGQGAGLLGGDRQHLSFDLKSDSHLCVAPIAASLILGSRNETAIETIIIRLGENASFHWKAQPIIPFANSCLKRQTRIYINASSRLLWEEFFMPGRTSLNELFAMESFRSRLSIYDLGKRVVLRENISLPFDQVPMTTLGLFGTATTMWNAWFYAPEEILEKIEPALKADDLDIWWGWSYLPYKRGFGVKMLGTPSQAITLQNYIRNCFGQYLQDPQY